MPLLQKQGHFRAEKMGMKNNPRFSSEGQIAGRFCASICRCSAKGVPVGAHTNKNAPNGCRKFHAKKCEIAFFRKNVVDNTYCVVRKHFKGISVITRTAYDILGASTMLGYVCLSVRYGIIEPWYGKQGYQNSVQYVTSGLAHKSRLLKG